MTTNVDAQEEFRSRFGEIMRGAADALLAQTVPGFVPQPQLGVAAIDSAGVVGFVGTSIRGMFFVGVAGEKVRAFRAELFDDWIGELANQLAGRVKNQLSRFGVSYDVCPPIMLRGAHLSVATVGAQSSLVYSCLGGECRVWVFLDVLKPIDLKEAAPEETPASEGELVLF